MPFEILNEAASVVYVLAGDNRYPQAEPDKVDFDILAQGINEEGVVSGCLVTPQGIPDTTVAVAAGVVRIAGTDVAYAGGNVNCGAAHAALPRFDLIIINAGGAAVAVNGVAAAIPVFPGGAAVPGTSVVIAAVWRAANDNTIIAADIVDKRCDLISELDAKSTELIDANDEITVPTTSWVYLNAGGAADNLLGIVAGREGQRVWLTPTAGKDITLIHNSGATVAGQPLMINGEANVLLDQDHDMVVAIYDSTAAVWNVLVPGAGGGGGYDTVEEEDVPLAQRTVLNFLGPMQQAIDDAANLETEIRNFSRYYDAIVAPAAEVAGLTGGTIPVYATLQLAITAGHVNIFLRGDHSGEAPVTINFADAVRRISGADRETAMPPALTIDRPDIFLEAMYFNGVGVTINNFRTDVMIFNCKFVGSAATITGGVFANRMVVLACGFIGVNNAITLGAAQYRCTVTACVFVGCGGSYCIQFGGSCIGGNITSNNFDTNSSTTLINMQSGDQQVQVVGNLVYLSSNTRFVQAQVFCNIAGNLIGAGGGSAQPIITLAFRNNVVTGNIFAGYSTAIAIVVSESGNEIANNMFVPASTSAGPIIQAGNFLGTSILGNSLIWQTGAATARVGIDLTAGANAAKAIIANNTFTTLTSQDFHIPVSGWNTNTTIRNNVGFDDTIGQSEEESDFHHYDTGEWTAISGGGGVVPALVSHPGGAVLLDTAGANGASSGLMKPQPGHILGSIARTGSFDILIEDYVVDNNRHWLFGLVDTLAAGTGNPAEGAFFRKSGAGNWFGVLRLGGLETAVDCGVATGHHFTFRFRPYVAGAGARAEWWIDGVRLAITITMTYLPTNNLRLACRLAAVGASRQRAYFDAYRVKTERPTP